MATEIRFEVDASRIDSHYGLTVFIHDSDSDPEDGEETPCYFLVFKGPDAGDPDAAARAFGTCHQAAMDSVGLEGRVSEEAFESLLEDSIELAGELMQQHGFEPVEVDTVDPGLMAALFYEEDEPETDPKKLN